MQRNTLQITLWPSCIKMLELTILFRGICCLRILKLSSTGLIFSVTCLFNCAAIFPHSQQVLFMNHVSPILRIHLPDLPSNLTATALSSYLYPISKRHSSPGVNSSQESTPGPAFDPLTFCNPPPPHVGPMSTDGRWAVISDRIAFACVQAIAKVCQQGAPLEAFSFYLDTPNDGPCHTLDI